MHIIFKAESNITSGLAIFLFNIFFLAVLRMICHSISASYNIHVIHEKQKVLCPQQSRLAAVVGGPVGYMPLSHILAAVIIVYEAIAFLFDFSINGSSCTQYIPTAYESMVRAHPRSIPLDIDYGSEYNETTNTDGSTTVFASRRLVAIAEAQACKVLNFTHHSNLAYVYEYLNLDTELVPMKELLEGGQCVQDGIFESDYVSQSFEQSYVEHHCSYGNSTVLLSNNCGSPRSVCAAELQGIEDSSCDISFHLTRCFRAFNNGYHCIAVGSAREDGSLMLAHFSGSKNGTSFRIQNQLLIRDLQDLKPKYYGRYAGNLAFLSAINFKYGVYNTMFMAVAQIEHNVTLVRTIKTKTTELDLNMAIPAFIGLVSVLFSAVLTAIVLRKRFVLQRGRKHFVSFSSISEIFNFDGFGNLTSKRAFDMPSHNIILKDGIPILFKSTNSYDRGETLIDDSDIGADAFL